MNWLKEMFFVSIVLCLSFTNSFGQEFYLDSNEEILYVTLESGCTFNSGTSLFFSENYGTFVDENAVFFVSVNQLLSVDGPVNYEVIYKKYSCSLDSLVEYVHFKIPSIISLQFNLNRTVLYLNNGVKSGYWDLLNLDCEEIKAFYRREDE